MFIEYIGLIAIALTALAAYNRYKKGEFSKDYKENQEPEKRSKFSQWWHQSHIREIYFVRASQRKLLCFIPWVGVWASGFAVFWFFIGAYLNLMNPIRPLTELTRYDGVVTGYAKHRKTDDILQVTLKDGTIKNFHTLLVKKGDRNDGKDWMGRDISVWTARVFGISTLGYSEQVHWKELDGKEIDIEKFEEANKMGKQRNHGLFPNLIRSIEMLLVFLGLLWFINRNPVTSIKN